MILERDQPYEQGLPEGSIGNEIDPGYKPETIFMRRIFSRCFKSYLNVVSDYFSSKLRSLNVVFVAPTLKNENLKFAFFSCDFCEIC